MFGILKSGIKLGVGCFVTIVLLLALVAGAVYYYWIRKPAPKPRNGNRRAAIVLKSGGSMYGYVSSGSIHFFRDGASYFENFSNRPSASESVNTTERYFGFTKPSATILFMNNSSPS